MNDDDEHVGVPPVVLASVPAYHPYVRGIHDPARVRLVAEPIPDPDHPDRWWPPAILDPEWIRDSAGPVDLVHVHFGFESLPEGRLARSLAELESARVPLVFTVHDLENPQLVDQRRHAADLDALIPGASALVTLTHGAARAIESRWGRSATVIPHPAIVPADAPLPAGTRTNAYQVGVHVRDLRPNIDGVGATRSVLEATRALRRAGHDTEATVVMSDVVRDAEAAETIRALVAAEPSARLRVRPRIDDAALWSEVADLDVAVLPYRHGSHSGWVEMCFDLGVEVVAPDTGFFGEQHPEATEGYRAADEGSMTDAVAAALARSRRAGTAGRREVQDARRRERRGMRPAILAAHEELYRGLLASPAC